MQKAAAVEWAEMNGVTLEFKGKYDQSTMMTDINSGGRPDLIYQANMFPGIANVGLSAPFTAAEYHKLEAICAGRRAFGDALGKAFAESTLLSLAGSVERAGE